MTSLVVTSVEFGKLKLELSLVSSHLISHDESVKLLLSDCCAVRRSYMREIFCLVLLSFAKCPFL